VPSYDIHHACFASNHTQKEYTHPAVHLSSLTWITMHALTLTERYSNLDKVPHTSLHLCMDIHQVRVFFLFTREIPIFYCPKMNTFCPIRGSEIRDSVKTLQNMTTSLTKSLAKQTQGHSGVIYAKFTIVITPICRIRPLVFGRLHRIILRIRDGKECPLTYRI